MQENGSKRVEEKLLVEGMGVWVGAYRKFEYQSVFSINDNGMLLTLAQDPLSDLNTAGANNIASMLRLYLFVFWGALLKVDADLPVSSICHTPDERADAKAHYFRVPKSGSSSFYVAFMFAPCVKSKMVLHEHMDGCSSTGHCNASCFDSVLYPDRSFGKSLAVLRDPCARFLSIVAHLRMQPVGKSLNLVDVPWEVAVQVSAFKIYRCSSHKHNFLARCRGLSTFTSALAARVSRIQTALCAG